MAIPTDFMEHLPRYEGGRTVPFPVHDTLDIILEEKAKIILNLFSKDVGVSTYVRAKSLKLGDKSIFRAEENAGNQGRSLLIG
ncbi:Uncharacterized protein TCM_007855 [Theobroma cacao]|uniref:Uncharacterized protein n=1 Tax=Theobroma cacao TaxID=3641 RepID=A0A061EAH3_THECC|nr:Uncharacterized protein TCM_007855 [Theobroma cacao]